MLNPQQLQHFNTFGFVILRNALSADEVETLRDQWQRRADEADRFVPFAGDKSRDMIAMGDSAPFITALFEDDRLAGIGEQIFDRLIGASAIAHRYVGDTRWHYDAGGYEAGGLKFAVYLDHVGADSGALRVIPGSHLQPFHDQVARFDPVGPKWSCAAATPEQAKTAREAIDTVPCVVCQTDPGDIVAFDLRTYHASRGGKVDRRMCSFTYYSYPHEPGETQIIIQNARGHMKQGDNSTEPWNSVGLPQSWLANTADNPRRADWIESLERFSQMELAQRGVKAVAEHGKWKIVPNET